MVVFTTSEFYPRLLTLISIMDGFITNPSLNCSNDSELVEIIINDIVRKLNYTISSDSKYLVGIHKRIEDMKLLLSHAPIVGIWGMGGLGKTTLANAIFKELHPHFEGHCFLANVREEKEKHGATYLRKLFFGKLSKEKNLDLANLHPIKQKLYRKKLLIVLDDVDDFEQYEHLVEDGEWLNSGSKVIITSRDQQVLRNIIGVREIYNLKELSEMEGLQLFCLYAFKRNFVGENDREMSRKFVNYAKGVPLALKVLGSHLHSKNKEEWESALNKLKVVPNKKILDILEISFAGLDYKEKDIFLDIACFFQGRTKNYVKEILDDNGCFADVIRVLVDKSLITVSNDFNTLRMHDLLQEMGWKIARGHKEFGKHSRLWISDHILHVLKNNLGSNTIEGIFLNDVIREDIFLKPDVFEKMGSLRLLQICDRCGFHFPQGLHHLPDELRYLDWTNFPLKSLGLHFTPRNLVCLCMPFSQLEKLWNEFQPGPRKLKYVDLSFSEKLTCLPNLSRANLKRLDLHHCKSLVKLPPLRFQNILNELTEEETKEMDDCVQKIREKINKEFLTRRLHGGMDISLMETSRKHATTTFTLNLNWCLNLKTLSEMSGNIKFLYLRSTAIEELHSSIGSLKNLVVIELRDCKYLKNLPSRICHFGSLEYLDMHGCVSIDKFPKLPKNIRGLDLSGTSITQVVESSFECMPHLEILYMINCSRLESLPTSICKLRSLKKLCLKGCSQLKSFPEILEPMENLKVLVLIGTGIKDIPASIENLVMLDTLNLSWSENLESVPINICKLKSLNTLDLSYCSKLKSFPEILEPMENLPSSIENLVGLRFLELRECKNLEFVPTSIYNMCNLRYVYVCGCPRLQDLPHYSFSLSPTLDPSGTTTGELPFCISKTFHDFECRCFCARKGVFFAVKYLDELKSSIGLTRCAHYWYKYWRRLTYCECLIFYTMHNVLMIQYFHNKVLKGKQCFSDPNRLDLGCEYHLKTYYGESIKHRWTLRRRHDARSNDDSYLENYILDWSSDHVFIWNLYWDHKYDYATGVSFEFYLGQSNSAFGKDLVKQCGIRMLFRQDAKEFDSLNTYLFKI
ncbi:TIR-NBS-LRR-like protein [Trema orientale]|uniref:TIR-NBS-LRR-like protein n=1 Tax=Trema orientale TaxID=63057 RepID=A0A2P5BBA9_TREOI|nr:TIR-NBS-LRR-like protein [Trema orientale]